jgi:hypothetical protein
LVFKGLSAVRRGRRDQIFGGVVEVAMKRYLSKGWLRVSVALALFLLVALLATGWYFRIWSWRDLQVYEMMNQECHPVWKDLYWGRVYAGQNVEEVIAATDPVRIERYGEFVRLSYQKGRCFTGVTITAKNGRLANGCAWSCTWVRSFFDELTPEDWARFTAAYEAHWRPLREEQ